MRWDSPSPWRGSTGIPKPFIFPLFSFGPHPSPARGIPSSVARRVLASFREQVCRAGDDIWTRRQKAGGSSDRPTTATATGNGAFQQASCPTSSAQSAPSNTCSQVFFFSFISFRSSVSCRVMRPADQREKEHELAAEVQKEISDGLFTQKDISIIQLFHLFSHGAFDMVQMKM